jgi:hypothetical protein
MPEFVGKRQLRKAVEDPEGFVLVAALNQSACSIEVGFRFREISAFSRFRNRR